jgi:O-acetyl-ADP-ribose deacetylase (regulator of RNase III)
MQLILTAVDESLATAWQHFCGDLDFIEIHLGSILEVACDAIVSPANSFGFMDGGIDALYLRRFGQDLQTRLQRLIAQKHHGELLVGAAEVLETGDDTIPYVIAAPTMRVPMVLNDSVNAYLAARAALLCALNHPGKIDRLAFPGMGTGVGQLSPNTCAHQMRAAIDNVLLNQHTPPRTWAEASERHQSLNTDHPLRLQRKMQP